MNSQNISTKGKEHEVIAGLVAAVGAGISFQGTQLLLEGYENNDPAMKKDGLRLVLAGGRCTSFAPLVQQGIISERQLMAFLDIQ